MAYRDYIEEVISIAKPLIKESEGCRLHAYPDPATNGDPWTIGYGATRIDGHAVRPTDAITQEQAEQLLENDMRSRLSKMLHHMEHTPKPHEAAAMLSFAFNVGLGALYHSTLLRKFNEGDIQGAGDEFLKWVHAGGRVMKGLVKRRAKEHDLFLGKAV